MKKLISILLCAVLLLGAVPAFAVSADETHVDLSSVADGGTYTDAKGNRYTVLKSAETIVATVTGNMSANYILGNDIDFNNKQFWRQIFQDSTGSPFTGIFDGNGYSIKNFFITSSVNSKAGIIFGGIAGDAKILNLTVGSEDAKIRMSVTATSPSTIGGLVSYTHPGSKAMIQNAHVYADISYETKFENSVRIGGIIGDTDPINIIDCSFHGSIVFAESAAIDGKVTQAGGIVGRCNAEANTDGTLNIINCKNYADLDITARTDTKNNASAVLGGILGSSQNAFNIRNCENYGSIKGENYTGGIVGFAKCTVNTTYAYDIVGCRNYGNVDGEYYVGGILGSASPSSENNSPSFSYTVSILNCLNAANVTQSTTNTSRLSGSLCAVGGIAGRIKRGYVTVENCASIGNIAGVGKMRNDSTAATANALFGNLYTNPDEQRVSVFYNCYAVGQITSYSEAEYTVYGTGSISMDKAIYKPFISNCYSAITTVNAGAFKTFASANAITTDYGDYTYVEPAAVTSTEVSDGTLLAKLGNQFEAKTIGTVSYPVPVQEEYVIEAGRENYFSNGDAGYFSDTGVWTGNKNYSTKQYVPVAEGTVVTVGALSTDQITLGHLFDGEKASVKKLTATDMELVSDLGNSYGIYSITIPEGVSYISITTFAQRAYVTLMTLDDEFDADGYYDFFGIKPMTGNSSSPLWRKSALFIGDSICYGFSDISVNGKRLSYGGRIAYNYDMEWVNAGVSGATLSTATNKIIIDQLDGLEYEEFDYVFIEGGINDALKGVSVGDITSGLSAPLDVTTYAGALEYTLKTVINTYPEAKIGFTTTYSVPRNSAYEVYNTYQDITKKICDKWDVECLDLFSNDEIDGPNGLDVANKNSSYLPDGIHPNAEGYERLYPYIATFMETLAVPVPNADYVASGSDTPPTTKPPVTQSPSDNGTTDTAEETTNVTTEETAAEEKKRGCGSLIGAPIMLMSALSLGVAATDKKRKDKK